MAFMEQCPTELDTCHCWADAEAVHRECPGTLDHDWNNLNQEAEHQKSRHQGDFSCEKAIAEPVLQYLFAGGILLHRQYSSRSS